MLRRRPAHWQPRPAVLCPAQGATTVPRVFIDGKFIGGADDLQALERSGELLEMLTAKGLMAEA